MGSQQQFCLRWNNHQVNMLNVFDQLLQNESFVDVTLACDGLSLKAHKVVLSACSPYFQKLLLDNPCQHPIVILKDVNYADLKALVDFMYKGEVNVLQDQLQELLKTAELLKIKGLCEVSPTSSTVDPTCVNLKQITTTATNIINHNSGKDSSSSDQQSLSQISLSPTQGSAIVAPLSSSSTRPALTASPPSKRKRAKPQRKSGSISDTDDNVSMLEIEGPPEIIESKVDVPQASMKMDLSSQSSVRTSMGNGMSIPKEEDDAETSSEQGPPEPKVHEGFSQENDDMNAPSLDPPTLLGMAGFSSSPSHQFNLSLPPGLPSQLSDAAGDDGNKNAMQKLEEYSDPTTSIATTASTIATTMVPAAAPEECDQDDPDRRGLNILGPQWTTNDMSSALDAIRHGRVTLTKASTLFSIPSTTLWQRAKREGIDTNKRDLTIASNWTEDDLHQALEAVRSGRLSITKAAVTFGIPNTTLWQRSRREGIDTSRTTGIAHQSNWTEANLSQALDAIRMGRMSVNKASSTFGIPSTTLWSRAKRYGIETGRRSIWEQDRDEVMWQALQAVKAGMVSMTQASIKFNVPYTTLWKHFKKWEMNSNLLPPASSSSTSSMSLNMSLPPPPSLPPPAPHHHHHHHHTPPAPHPPHSSPMGITHHIGIPLHSHSIPHQHPHSHPHPIENILPENATNNSMNS